MDSKTIGQTLAAIAFGTLLAQGATARAHIDIDMGGTHDGRPGDIKVGPCGGQPRGSAVHTYKPGETITLSVIETIPHPGYFRIAFDQDGQDGFAEPSGTDGMGGNCAGDPKCGAGKADYCNNETVLLDNLDPHASAAQNTKRTWTVTLPNVECDNCTLQVIQVMNDLNIHFLQPYPGDDIYHGCIDLVLSNSAPDVNDTPVVNNGMVCNGGGEGGTGGFGGVGGVGGSAGVGGVGGSAGVGGAAGMAGAGGTGGLIGGMGGAAGAAGMAGAAGAGAFGGAAGAAGFGPPAGAGGGTTTQTSGCSVSSGRAANGTGFGVLLGLAVLYRSRRRGISSTKLQG